MVGVKIKGNRIEIGDWFILIKVQIDDFSKLPDAKFVLMNKHSLDKWNFDTLEEAWEKVNERV